MQTGFLVRSTRPARRPLPRQIGWQTRTLIGWGLGLNSSLPKPRRTFSLREKLFQIIPRVTRLQGLWYFWKTLYKQLNKFIYTMTHKRWVCNFNLKMKNYLKVAAKRSLNTAYSCGIIFLRHFTDSFAATPQTLLVR